MHDVRIEGGSIRLGQLLKLAGLADSGANAKELLTNGAVSVNDEPEDRRGRQLAVGDVVSCGGQAVRLV